jgi:hypothetical protein
MANDAHRMTFPRVRTVASGPSLWDHNHLHVWWSVDQRDPIVCCGEQQCRGECKFPALVLPAYNHEGHEVAEQKARNCHGAICPLFERWKVKWEGEKEIVPEEHRATMRVMFWR